MLVIKISNEEVANRYEHYLKSIDLAYTRNGAEFEIPSGTPEGFILGRYYEYTLNKVKNELQLQEKEETAKDIGGLKP